MKDKITSFYRFLPIQLFLLHFRKAQLLLVFWLILFATVTNHFATNFGAASLFLSPEYLGKTNFASFFILGTAFATFSMGWHITTFIVHSQRLPFLGTMRHTFLKYVINNTIIPITFLIVYSICVNNYLTDSEQMPKSQIILNLFALYSGYIFILILSFTYFFRVNKDILKYVLARIANPSLIRNIIPSDSLDKEYDYILAHSYLDSLFRIKKIDPNAQYNQRVIEVILRRHHRNVVLAVLMSLILLLIVGIFMQKPIFRIPAGSSFLLLFTILTTIVGAFKYFLQSWQVVGWLLFGGLISFLIHLNVFDMRSMAYGMDYNKKSAPVYDYSSLKDIFSDSLFLSDKENEINRLNIWAQKERRRRNFSAKAKIPMVVVAVSGGGSRSAYWSFRCLQVADSMTKGQFFNSTTLISGASGGMIGAAYWNLLQTENSLQHLKNPYAFHYQENIGKDFLNAIVFSFATVDLISVFNKITIADMRYTKDRGFAFDQELITNTDGLLNKTIGDLKGTTEKGISPLMLINGTIINDGRKLMISPIPISYLGRSIHSLGESDPMIDGVDYLQFFKNQNPENLQLSTALRMSATFPLILPIVKLPAQPELNVMDAGLRDNYGTENSVRYLHTFKEWIHDNISDLIFVQIRDTKETEPSELKKEGDLSTMLFDPIFAIQKKWASFQTFKKSYSLDLLKDEFPESMYHEFTIQYIPTKQEQKVALNFHLTDKEKQFLLASISYKSNQDIFEQIQQILNHSQ